MKSHGKTRVILTDFTSYFDYLNYFVQDFEIAQSVARWVCTFLISVTNVEEYGFEPQNHL